MLASLLSALRVAPERPVGRLLLPGAGAHEMCASLPGRSQMKGDGVIQTKSQGEPGINQHLHVTRITAPQNTCVDGGGCVQAQANLALESA